MTHSGTNHQLLTKLLALLLAAPMAALASNTTKDHPLVLDTSEVRVTVRDVSGAPVRDAKITMKILTADKEGVIEVKTDDRGQIEQDIIPINGIVHLQIAAKGYQSFSTDYKVNAFAKDLVVRLKPGTSDAAMDAEAAPSTAFTATVLAPRVVTSAPSPEVSTEIAVTSLPEAKDQPAIVTVPALVTHPAVVPATPALVVEPAVVAAVPAKSEQPVVTATLAQSDHTSPAVAAAQPEQPFVYKEAQWVTRTPHHAAPSAHSKTRIVAKTMKTTAEPVKISQTATPSEPKS